MKVINKLSILICVAVAFLCLSFISLSFKGKSPPIYIERADISSDGSLVAFIIKTKKENKSPGDSQLFVYSLKENKKWKIAKNVLGFLAWDGKNTLWFQVEETNGTFSTYSWRKGMLRPKLLLKGRYINPCPSPDGKWLVCAFYPPEGVPESEFLKESRNLIVYDLQKNKLKKVAFHRNYMPLFFQWSPDSSYLFIYCLGMKPTEYGLFLLKPPSFQPRVISSKAYAIAGGSWCLSDGSIVYVEVEGAVSSSKSETKIPVAPPGFPFSSGPSTQYNFWRYSEAKGKKLLWTEKGYDRLFAVSLDGRHLLIPHEDIDLEKRRYFYYLNLVDLNRKDCKRVEREEIRESVLGVRYNEGLGGFVIICPKGLYLLNSKGQLSPLLMLEKVISERE
ncbi:hypothetical protein H5T87_08740 [bacterium]|nr:hypothetical protein [bacterium]